MRKSSGRLGVIAMGLLSGSALSQAAEPPVPSNPLRSAYFGDLHLHTANSIDAYWAGVRTTPRDAYRYAQGQPISYFGQEIRRKAPLDFLAVSDHAEYLGIPRQVLEKLPPFEESNWFAELSKKDGSGLLRLMSSGLRGTETIPELSDVKLVRNAWQAVVDVANEFNRPGRFTTFPAFEWSETPGGAHFHRVAIFPGPKFPDRAFSALDSRHPEDLWRYADAARARGIDSVLIPHNANLSNGLQFALDDSFGKPIDRAWADSKRRNEPLLELTQNKGTSETHPSLSPDDEFSGFEILEHVAEPGRKVDLAGSYARSGLLRGLALGEKLGRNPYAPGFVGSSDYHAGATATEEDNFTGALGDSDLPRADNITKILTDKNNLLRSPMAVISASGITGVWAERNTRESIFAAFKRREVYATSGPRIQVRLFAGYEYPAGLVQRADWLKAAYAKGVPMGATLQPSSTRRSPRFLVHAMKDPDGANLDRIQIVKLWREDGKDRERVFDVVASGGRRPDAATGKLPPVGNTVDTTRATYSNSIGAAQLAGEWSDPEFKPALSAVYYARVIEIPTPRWTTYLAARNGAPLSPAVPATIQERAWTSPVYYRLR